MLVKNLSCPNQKNTNYMYRLPFNTCCTINKCGKDHKYEIDDKTKGEMKENIKSELEKDHKCEIDDKTKDEMKENIKNEMKKDLKCETCEIDDKTKNELKKNIKSELEKDLKCKCTKEETTEETTKEVDESGCNRRGCENARKDGEYVNVGSDANLYIRKELDKFYPDLSAEIIKKLKMGIIM